MHRHWPNRFEFDTFASESLRERQRSIIVNAHRKQSESEVRPR
jgi:hypothetical protein